jgi:hypothetical protein
MGPIAATRDFWLLRHHLSPETSLSPSHTRSQIVGDNEALPRDWSQILRPSPFEALIFWIPSQKALTNSVRVTFSRRSLTKELQFHLAASSFGPPRIDSLNSLNVTRAFSLCFAHSSSLISGGGSWGAVETLVWRRFALHGRFFSAPSPRQRFSPGHIRCPFSR